LSDIAEAQEVERDDAPSTAPPDGVIQIVVDMQIVRKARASGTKAEAGPGIVVAHKIAARGRAGTRCSVKDGWFVMALNTPTQMGLRGIAYV